MKIDLSKEQLTVVVLVVGVIASAMFVSPAMVFGGETNSDAKTGETYYTSSPTVDNPGGSGSNGGPGTFSEANMLAVPDGYTETTTPGAAEPPKVSASAGAQTMSVTATKEDGEVALKLSDDRVHSGRWVSVPASWFISELGGVPEVAYVEHESGDSYETSLFARGDSVAFYVEEFSTNTVTFSGEVQITGEFTDGSQAQYEIDNLDAASDPVVNVTGVESTETDTESATLSNGGTLSLSPAGSETPTNPSVTFSGDGFGERRDDYSATDVSLSHTASISVDGALQPTDGSGNDPALSVTAHASPSQYNPVDVQGDGTVDSDYLLTGDTINDGTQNAEVKVIPQTTGTVTNLTPNFANVLGSRPAPLDIYMVQGTPDSTMTDGTLVKDNWQPSWTTGTQSVTLDTEFGVSAGTSYSVAFVTTSSDGGGDADKLYLANDNSTTGTWQARQGGATGPEAPDLSVTIQETPKNVSVSDGAGHSATFGDFSDGQTKTRSIDLRSGSTELAFSGSGGGALDYQLTMLERDATVDPSLDLSNDGTTDASYNGTLSNGESVSKSLPGLALSTSSATVHTASQSAPVSAAVSYTEHTLPSDVGVELNSETTSYSGTLGDGETVSMNVSKSALREGTNYLNVSLGGSVSSDAPAQLVNVTLNHDAVNKQTVDYSGGQWTESYSVSETYASDRRNATLTIPFKASVYQIQSIKAGINGSSPSAVGSGAYSLENTTLTVDLSSIYGGTIPDGSSMTVNATGIAVNPVDSDITVTNPTTPGQPLDSTIKINSWGPDAGIAVDGTPRGDRAHYTSSESWNASEYSRWTGSGGQTLVLPSASGGDTFTVETLPLRIEPTGGDVRTRIPDDRVNRSQPVFKVTPGESVGDSYDVTFTNASDGEDYVLWSETNEVVIDSGTASSPLTLTDEEDNVALMQFMVDPGLGGDDSSSGGGGGAPVPMPTTGGDTNFIPLIGVAIAGGLVLVAARNDGLVENAGESAAGSIESNLGNIPVVGPMLGKTIAGGVETIAKLAEAVAGNQTVAMLIVGALGVGAVQGGIIEVPQSSLTLIVIAGIGIFSLVALRELGEFTTARWAAILATTTIVAVQTLSDESLLTAIVNSEVWPILAIAGVFLAYRGIQGIRQPDSVTRVMLDTNQSDGDSGGGSQ